MSSEDFFNLLRDHLAAGNPTVGYRLPGKESVHLLSQTTKNSFRIKDFSESGFVFAPFKSIENPLFIPESESTKTFLAHFAGSDFGMNAKDGISEGDEDPRAKSNHINLVEAGAKAIKESDLKKVVLSRKEFQKVKSSAIEIFQNLLLLYPNAFVIKS